MASIDMTAVDRNETTELETILTGHNAQIRGLTSPK